MLCCDLVRSHRLSSVRGGDYLHWRSLRYTVVILTIQKITPFWVAALFCSKRYSVFWCRQIARAGVPWLYTSSGTWLFWKSVLLSWVVSNKSNYFLLPSKMCSNLPYVLASFCLMLVLGFCLFCCFLSRGWIPLWICYALGLIESKWIQYRTNAKLSLEECESVPPHDVPFFSDSISFHPFLQQSR